MSKEMFMLGLAAGAGLLAVWIYARFPRLTPERMLKTLLHTGAAFALLMLTPGLGESAPAMLAGLFLFVLPALVYALLCSLWVLKHAQTALGVPR
jgi:O-antigen/teichoic acid export membrane protein